MKQDIAIFTPMANEEKNKKFVSKFYLTKIFRKFKYFVILDNASKDETFNIVKKIEKKIKISKLFGAPKIKL